MITVADSVQIKRFHVGVLIGAEAAGRGRGWIKLELSTHRPSHDMK